MGQTKKNYEIIDIDDPNKREVALESTQDKKLVVLCAVNGGAQQSREGAFVPTTPAEIAEAAFECYKAGAAAVHVHARGANKGPTSDLKVFSEIVQRIRDKCDVLVQTTNGFGVSVDPKTNQQVWPPDLERLALFSLEPRQDLFSIAAGSWDFFHPEGGYNGTVAYMNNDSLIRENIKSTLRRGGSLEFEIAEVSQMYKIDRYAQEGIIDRNSKNFWFDFCIGFGAMVPTVRTLALAMEDARRLFPDWKLQVCGTGREQFSMNTVGVLMGCDIVRVGFEDNIYLPNGKPGKRNADLVEAMIAIGRTHGREPATVSEARKVWNLN